MTYERRATRHNSAGERTQVAPTYIHSLISVSASLNTANNYSIKPIILRHLKRILCYNFYGLEHKHGTNSFALLLFAAQ